MESLTYSIHADEEFYRLSLDRQRSVAYGRRGRQLLRAFAAVVAALVVASACLTRQMDFSDVAVVAAMFVLYFVPRADWFIFRRRLRKSTHCVLGEMASLRLDDEGVYGEAERIKGSMAWSTCTKAVEFDDGVLLYHGPTFFRWLPHAALQDGARPQDVVGFIKGRVPNYERR